MRFFYLFILIVSIFQSCNKEGKADDATCENVRNATIYANTPLTIGQTLKFGTQEVGGYRIYTWRGPHNFDSQYPENTITSVQLENEGWYYLHLNGGNGSCIRIDSVYIDVKLPQGNPSCTVTTNTTTFNNLGSNSYSSVNKMIDPTYSLKTLDASGGVGSNMKIHFHPRWRTAEPEDGIYTTINTPSFGQTDNNYNKVFVTTTKSSIYWSSQADQTIYVSHVGTKLQVRFCSLNMSGYNGSSYLTQASGNIVEQ